jgi:DNA-binding CsgD family transcriptional regulator
VVANRGTADVADPAGNQVGRVKERALAREHLRRARSGTPCPLLITGEPGTGKSALLSSVVDDAAATGFRTLGVRADRVDAGVPYAALRLALDQEVGDGGDVGSTRVAELRRLLDPSSSCSAHAPPSEVAPRLRLVLAEWAFRCPVLLGVDDLHLADGDTSAVVLYLMAHLRRERVAIVATSRTQPFELDATVADGVARLRMRDDLAVIELAALGRTELAALVAARCGAPPDEPLLDALDRRTAGNPLLAVELLRAMAADGALATEHGAVRLDASHELSLPSVVSAAVVHRLSLLDPDAVPVGAAVAIVGRVPLERLDTLAAVADVDRRRATKAFDALVAARVLARCADGYHFVQPLVGDVLYGTVGPGRLAAAHGTAVVALRAAMARGERVDAVELAQHARRAEGARPMDAAVIFERAGDELVASAPDTAADWYRAALGDARSGADIARLSLRRARALGAAGATDDAVHESLGAVTACGSAEVRAEAVEVASYALVGAGRFDDAAELLDRRLREREVTRTPTRSAARLGVARAVVATWQGSPVAAATHLGDAGRRLSETRPLAEAVWVHVCNAAGRYREARATADRARGQAESLPVDARAAVRGALMAAEAIVGDARGALKLGDSVHACAPPTAWSNALVAWASFRLGRWDAACAAAESAVASATIAPSPAVAALAIVRAERGDFSGSSAALRQRTSGGVGAATMVLAAARLHRHSGDPERSVRVLLDACATARADARCDTLALLLPELAEAAVAAGDDDLASASVDELQRIPVDSGVAPTVGALLVSALVHRDAAAATEAHAIAASYELSPDVARARSIFGMVRGDADGLIDAFCRFDAMGAVVRRREMRSELHHLGRRPPRRRRSGALTAVEIDIADLVARGLTNRQIAKACCLSPKTVEVYLSRVFLKAGCRSRVELAVLVNAGTFASAPRQSQESGTPY